MPLVGGPTRNLGAQLTLLQPGGEDFAHHNTASPPGFETPAAALNLVTLVLQLSLFLTTNHTRIIKIWSVLT